MTEMSNDTAVSGPFVALLEADSHQAEAVAEALREIDPKIQLVPRASIAEILRLLTKEDPLVAVEAVPRLLILPAEESSLPANLEKLLPGVTLPPLLVTSFEHSEALVKKWSPSGAFNLLQKPYDPLLLRQHLRIALSPNAPPKSFETHNFKTSAVIEMLKEIPMEAVSEVGIVTRSDREIPLGRVTKVYGKIFSWQSRTSVYVRSIDQRPHALSPQEKSVYMTLFGVAREQSLQIRSRFPREELPLIWRPSAPSAAAAFLVLGDPSPAGSELAGTLSRSFNQLEIQSYMDVPGPKVPLPENLKAVFLHRSLFEAVDKDARFKEIPKILITTTVPTDAELRQDAARGIDLITLPTERVSFFKKISILFPQLQPSGDITIHSYRWKEAIDVGQPIEITEMNETGLTMKYERPLPPGSIRRFVLWQPVELGMPILTARCYLNGKDAQGQALNYFVFFGMSDAEIKHVRIWMRDHFIHDKTKGQA